MEQASREARWKTTRNSDLNCEKADAVNQRMVGFVLHFFAAIDLAKTSKGTCFQDHNGSAAACSIAQLG